MKYNIYATESGNYTRSRMATIEAGDVEAAIDAAIQTSPDDIWDFACGTSKVLIALPLTTGRWQVDVHADGDMTTYLVTAGTLDNAFSIALEWDSWR